MNRVLVIVVTYNALRWADQCFGRLRESEEPVDLFVVDNGSTDGTQDYLRSHCPEAVFVQNPSNTGFGQANNIGLRYALEKGYEYVYLLNQDAWIFPDTLGELIAAHQKHPENGILSPMQFQADLRELDVQFYKRLDISSILDSRLEPAEPDMESFRSLMFQTNITEVPYIMAAHWLISRDCLRKTGLFSPIFPHWGEDENYCDRAIYHGFKVGCVFSAKAVHDRAVRREPVSVKVRRNYYMKTISGMSRISAPRRGLLYAFTYACYNVLKYKTFEPLHYFMEILRQCRSIRRCREASRDTCAFY